MSEPDEGFLPQDQGWMSVEELRFLRHIATGASANGGFALELGTYKGLSTSALAQGAVTICVDTFTGTPGESTGGQDTFAAFLANMEKVGLRSSVVVLRTTTGVALQLLRGTPIGCALVDASHQEQDALADMEGAWDLLMPGGTLLVDDLDHRDQPGVRKAVARFEVDHDVLFEFGPRCEKLAYVVKD